MDGFRIDEIDSLRQGMSLDDACAILGDDYTALEQDQAQLEPGIFMNAVTSELYEWRRGASVVRVLFVDGRLNDKFAFNAEGYDTAARTLQVGFVGLGGICRDRHVPGLRRISGVEIAAVANRTRESGERAAEEFGIPHVHDTWEELVERDDIDAVFIGTYPNMHGPVSVAALNAGKHAFCQARMATDFEAARQMYDAAVRSGCVAMLCPVPFGLKYDGTVRRMLDEGALGDIRLVRVESMSDAFMDPAAPISWRKDASLSGLNVHTLGMYVEVLHRWFGGTDSVCGDTHTFVEERPLPDGAMATVRVPDQVLFNAVLYGGVPAQFVISTCAHHGRDVIEVYGTQGALRYDVKPDEMYFAKKDGDFEEVTVEPDVFYDVKNWRVEQDFIDAIRTGSAYRPNFEDGLKYMAVVQAVHDSASAGRRVSVAGMLAEAT